MKRRDLSTQATTIFSFPKMKFPILIALIFASDAIPSINFEKVGKKLYESMLKQEAIPSINFEKVGKKLYESMLKQESLIRNNILNDAVDLKISKWKSRKPRTRRLSNIQKPAVIDLTGQSRHSSGITGGVMDQSRQILSSSGGNIVQTPFFIKTESDRFSNSFKAIKEKMD
jgi:hypothetical protein